MLNKIAHKTQEKTNEENEEIKLLQPLSQFPLKSAHVCWLFFGSLAGFVVRGKRGGGRGEGVDIETTSIWLCCYRTIFKAETTAGR